MKKHHLQSALVGIILSFAVLVPSTVSAQRHKRENRKVERKQNQKARKGTSQYQYVNNNRYKNIKYQNPHYTKRVYKPAYKQHAYQIHKYYPAQPKGTYTTVFTCLPSQTQVMHFNGHKYYHYNKVYFRHHPAGGFVMVQPPKYVQTIPPTSLKVMYNGRLAYYYGGVYFSWTPKGYVIL